MEPLVLGFLVALLVSLTGVGGGAVMTPALVYWLGVPLETAIGTDLVYIVATKAIALYGYTRAGQVRWTLVRGLLQGSLPAAAVVLAAIALLGETAGESFYRPAVGLALAVTACVILAGRPLGERLTALRDVPAWVLLPLAGAVLGSLVAVSSIGAGALGVTAVLLVAPAIPARQLVATDLAQAFPLALVAGAGHALMGHVDSGLLLYLLLGAVPGALAGCQLSGYLPRNLLTNAIGLVLLVASISLFIN